MSYILKTITNTRAERFYWRIASIVMVGDLLIGLGFIFGAPTHSTSYDAAKALMPLEGWGVVALIAYTLFSIGMIKHNRWLILLGTSLGGFYTFLFGISFIFTAFAGLLAGFTGIIWWVVIGMIHTAVAMSLPSTLQIKGLRND